MNMSTMVILTTAPLALFIVAVPVTHAFNLPVASAARLQAMTLEMTEVPYVLFVVATLLAYYELNIVGRTSPAYCRCALRRNVCAVLCRLLGTVEVFVTMPNRTHYRAFSDTSRTSF